MGAQPLNAQKPPSRGGESVAPTTRTKVRRQATRAVYDRQAIYSILDEALVCHVGIIDQGQPYVLPMTHVRIDDRLYLHGSPVSRKLRYAGAGGPLCITVTLLDGLVLARSAMHHTVNYRSVVILAGGEVVGDRVRKREVLRALVEHVIPGRSSEIREPSEAELDATMIISVRLNEMSAKIRTGPPKGDEPDHALPVWAGELPLALQPGVPIPDPHLGPDVPVPAYVISYSRSVSGPIA